VKLNRTLAFCLAIALSTALAIGGSMAYLTSTDGDYNTMTVGNVVIEQIEQQRGVDADGNPTLDPFAQDKHMIPAYYDELAYDGKVIVNGAEYPIFDESVDGEVDKIVTVKNTGSDDAYVRTIVAFEHTDFNGDGDFSDGIAEKLHFRANGTDWTVAKALDHVKIGDNDWQIYTFTYNKVLAKETESEPNLMQVFFDKSVTGDELAKVGDKYEILVLSQAVQAQMGTLEYGAALDEAFGPVTEANVQAWLLPRLPTAPAAPGAGEGGASNDTGAPDVDEGGSED